MIQQKVFQPIKNSAGSLVVHTVPSIMRNAKKMRETEET